MRERAPQAPKQSHPIPTRCARISAKEHEIVQMHSPPSAKLENARWWTPEEAPQAAHAAQGEDEGRKPAPSLPTLSAFGAPRVPSFDVAEVDDELGAASSRAARAGERLPARPA